MSSLPPAASAPLRVLLTNHHLCERAGSELYVWELAHALRARGHDVRVFSFQLGPLAQAMRDSGVPVYGPEEGAAVEAFVPDVAHVHHGPCLWWVGALALECPVIFSSLGVVPAHEAPPPSWPGVALGVAVSEEVRARLSAAAFGQAVPLHVLRNWFDDGAVPLTPARPPPAVRTVAVVSNHLSEELAAHLEALAREGAIRWTHLGLPQHSVPLTPQALAPFDAVVTIGRTALLAAAMGKPVLLADVHGSDGWMEVQQLDAQASVNFSGRLMAQRPTLAQLRALLQQAPTLDVEALQRAVHRDFKLSQRAAAWEALYGIALASPQRLDAHARSHYRPLAALYAGALSEVRRAQHQVAALEAHAAALEAHSSAVEAHAAALAQRALAEREALEVAARQAQVNVERLAAQLSAPGAPAALSLLARATQLRRKWLPVGTWRHTAFAHAKAWFERQALGADRSPRERAARE